MVQCLVHSVLPVCGNTSRLPHLSKGAQPVSQPMEPFESQNVNDDDGQVIDSFFIATDAPPKMEDATQPIVVSGLREPDPITRLFSGDMVLAADWEPVLLLPADKNRKSLNVYVYSPSSVATDGMRFSDDKGNIRTSGKILHNGTVDLGAHTGPVYVLPTGAGAGGSASAPVSIQYWSVTA